MKRIFSSLSGALLAALLALGIAGCSRSSGDAAGAATPPVPVQVAMAMQQDVPRLAALRHPQLYGQVRSRHRLHLPRQRL